MGFLSFKFQEKIVFISWACLVCNRLGLSEMSIFYVVTAMNDPLPQVRGVRVYNGLHNNVQIQFFLLMLGKNKIFLVWVTPEVNRIRSFCIQCLLADKLHFIFVNVDKAVFSTVLLISSVLSLAADQVPSSGVRPGCLCLFPSPFAISRSVKFILPSSILAP